MKFLSAVGKRLPIRKLTRTDSQCPSDKLTTAAEGDHISDLGSDEITSSSLTQERSANYMNYQALRSMCSWWAFELCGVGLYTIGMAVLFVLFGYFDGRPQQEWHFLTDFTLNAVIAIVATITKTALTAVAGSTICQNMWNYYAFQHSDRDTHRAKYIDLMPTFDEASRGVWGGLRLLWRLRCSELACLGALLTVCYLGFETFAQQVVTVEYRNIPAESGSNLIGAVDRCMTYNGYVGDTASGTELGTKAALYAGLAGTGPQGPTSFCTTGICSFPTVTTVGVCAECRNVTSLLELSYAQPNTSSGLIYNLPDTTHLQPSNNESFVLWPSGGRAFDDIKERGGVFINHFDIIGLSPEHLAVNEQSVLAYECGIWWCLQAYEINIASSVVTNTIIDTWPDTSRWIENATSVRYNFTNVPPHFNIEPNTVPSFSELSNEIWRRSLDTTMWGNVTLSFDDLDLMTSHGTHNSQNSFELTMMLLFGAIWQQLDHLEDQISNTSASLSNDVAQAGGARLTVPALVSVAFTRVRWGWTVYPVILVVTTSVFLFLSMLQRRRLDIPPWRSNPLALLVIGLDDATRRRGEEYMSEKKGLDRGMNQVTARLVREDDRWAFRQ